MSAPAYEHPFRKRDEELDRYINLKLAAMGQPVSRSADFLELARPLLRNYYQKDRQLGN
jgi:DNA-binding IclR family transcriptional regulator